MNNEKNPSKNTKYRPISIGIDALECKESKQKSEKGKLMWLGKSLCHLTSSLLQDGRVLSFITLCQKVP